MLWGAEAAEEDPEPISMDINEVMAILPHRFPFLMVRMRLFTPVAWSASFRSNITKLFREGVICRSPFGLLRRAGPISDAWE